ncbi:hypothetical protein BD310DRAFT_386057, partial [Dichomitus squalens]
LARQHALLCWVGSPESDGIQPRVCRWIPHHSCADGFQSLTTRTSFPERLSIPLSSSSHSSCARCFAMDSWSPVR